MSWQCKVSRLPALIQLGAVIYFPEVRAWQKLLPTRMHCLIVKTFRPVQGMQRNQMQRRVLNMVKRWQKLLVLRVGIQRTFYGIVVYHHHNKHRCIFLQRMQTIHVLKLHWHKNWSLFLVIFLMVIFSLMTCFHWVKLWFKKQSCMWVANSPYGDSRPCHWLALLRSRHDQFPIFPISWPPHNHVLIRPTVWRTILFFDNMIVNTTTTRQHVL